MKTKYGMRALGLLLVVALAGAIFVPGVSAYQADSYGFDTDEPSPLDTRPTANYVKNKLSSMGYSPSDRHYDERAIDGYNELEDTDVFFFSGHSSPGRLQFGENAGGRLTFIFADGTLLPRISEMSQSQLSNLKLAVYLGCYSATTDHNLGNLVEETSDKGADCVIGFEQTVNSIAADYWAREFFDALDDGQNIGNAFDIAWWAEYLEYGDDGGLSHKTIEGDDNQVIDLY
ncbi:C25 family cysteine peptidase [Methanolacinia paynteri]|uniref:C25 family cysteine peptidase n=1 Tax=Methanolacinia paynteri TaxID=230356 RepID=UPI00064F0A3F|nr:C25 family cysteine peptidase [Methanolacinia paynteri]